MKNIDKLRQMGARELAQFLLNYDNSCANCVKCRSECGEDCDGTGCVDGIERWLDTEVNPLPSFRAGMVISYFNGYSALRDAVMLDDRWAYDFYVGLLDTVELRKSDEVVVRKIYVCEDSQFKLIWEAD